MENAVIARKRKTQKKKQKVIFTLITLLSSLITRFNLNLMLLKLNDDIYYKRRRKLLSTLTLSMPILRAKSSRKAPVERRFWVRPGRTSAWWDNFVQEEVTLEEWRENFRMSRNTFLILCEELRLFIQKKPTNMRLPVDVERQVASSLYYLSDERRIRKTANSFGLSRAVISVIIRRVCTSIAIHLGPKYIKLPYTEAGVQDLITNFFLTNVVFHSV